MIRMRKYILCLAAVLLLCSLFASAEAAQTVASGDCGKAVTWALDSKGTLTISGTGPMEDYGEGSYLYGTPFSSWDPDRSDEENLLAVRQLVVKEGVESIGIGAFRDMKNLERVTIPDSVTVIGSCAFMSDSALKEITVPAAVSFIGDGALRWCDSLKTITVREGNPVYQSIDGVLFSKDGTELLCYGAGRTDASYAVPEGVIALPQSTFSNNTALKDLSIPASVSSIGDPSFYGCTCLETITVSGDNPVYRSIDGVLFSKDGTELICYGAGRTDAAYRVPDGVAVLRPAAFAYCGALKQIRFPFTLKTIRYNAFQDTGLTGVVLPPDLTVLESRAFSSCRDLTRAVLPPELTALENGTFSSCGKLTSVSIPLSLTEVGWFAFDFCPLSDVYYEGVREQWSAIGINQGNDALGSAAKHYEAYLYCAHSDLTYCPPAPHTCTENGVLAHWVCETCGSCFSDAKAETRLHSAVDPAAHSYRRAVVTEPTCSEPGVRVMICPLCDPSTQGHTCTEEIPPTHLHHFVNDRCDNLLRDGKTVCGVQDKLESGDCGSGLKWKLDSSGTLTIYGTGQTEDYAYMTTHVSGLPARSYWTYPWADCSDQIKTILIGEGVTGLGQSAFGGVTDVTSLILPESLKTIETGAFQNCRDLKDVYYAGNGDQWRSVVRNPSNDPLAFADYHWQSGSLESQTLLFDPKAEAGEVTVRIVCREPAAAWCCLYDGDGRFLGAERRDLTGSGDCIEIFSPALPEAKSLRIVVLSEESLAPLCPGVSADLSQVRPG